MTAINQDVTVRQNNGVVINIPVRDETGANVDLTGATAEWWVADLPPPGEALATEARHIRKYAGAGLVIVSSGGLYTIRVTLVKADTANLRPGTYYHECAVVDVSGNPSTVATGRFEVKQTIIRP